MKIAVLGGDGYCGWVDSSICREGAIRLPSLINICPGAWDPELGAQRSAPIVPLTDRVQGLEE